MTQQPPELTSTALSGADADGRCPPAGGPRAARKARFWDRMARRYAAAAIADPSGYERSLARTRHWLGLAPEGMAPAAPATGAAAPRVLEIGCGTGTSALRLAPGCAVYVATDLSPRMIDIARGKLAAQPVPGLRFACADADAPLAAKGESFDAVLAFNVLHLLDDVDATLARAAAALRPGGLLISKTPSLNEMHWAIPNLAVPLARAIGLAPPVLRLSEASLVAAHMRQGFNVLAVERHASRGRDVRPYIVARKGSAAGAPSDGAPPASSHGAAHADGVAHDAA